MLSCIHISVSDLGFGIYLKECLAVRKSITGTTAGGSSGTLINSRFVSYRPPEHRTE
jgi:hypothetical protein